MLVPKEGIVAMIAESMRVTTYEGERLQFKLIDMLNGNPGKY